MRIFFFFIFFLIQILIVFSCKGQTTEVKKTAGGKIVGGGCDGCEIMYVGMPASINSVDTNTAWNGPGQKMVVNGKVFHPDGKTPAPGVVIYYWQTDHTGLYTPAEGMDPKARIHGAIRGWVKTDKEGNYSIYTIRPGNYPDEHIVAHIHYSIKEPAIKNEYYIDDLVFEGDPYLNENYTRQMQNRGGSGVSTPVLENGVQYLTRDVILGMNIPDHPGRD